MPRWKCPLPERGLVHQCMDESCRYTGECSWNGHWAKLAKAGEDMESLVTGLVRKIKPKSGLS